MNQNRTPAGVPAGGQFAEQAKTESCVGLRTDDGLTPASEIQAGDAVVLDGQRRCVRRVEPGDPSVVHVWVDEDEDPYLFGRNTGIEISHRLGDACSPRDLEASQTLLSPPVTWTAPGATAYVEIGTAETNTYVGASRALAKVFEEVELTETDVVITSGSGGRCLVVEGRRLPLRFAAEQKHLFERGGTPDPAPESGRLIEEFDPRSAEPVPMNEWPRFDVGDDLVKFGAMDFVRPRSGGTH